MKYMLLICVGEDVQLTPEEGAEMERATLAWVDEMEGRGVRLQGRTAAASQRRHHGPRPGRTRY